MGKPAILITQCLEDLPVDLRGRRAIAYQDRSKELKSLQEDLRIAIRSILQQTELRNEVTV